MARTYVEFPAPRPKVGGLYPVATVVDVDDLHILMGVQAESRLCTPAREWEHKCPIEFPGDCAHADDPARQKKIADAFFLMTGDPFTVYDMIECRDKADYSDEVRASLALKEQAAVERHVIHAIDHLSVAPDPDHIPKNIVEAVAFAEESVANDYAAQGLIHMSPVGATLAVAAQVVFPSIDGGLATALGTPVVAGAGYTRIKSTEVFATGQVVLYRGPVLVQNVPSMQNGAVCEPPRSLAERTVVPLVECGIVKYTITTP
jgi:hypothetical protein